MWVVKMWIGEVVIFLFQANDDIRDLVRSRGLGNVYKKQSSLQQALIHEHLPVEVSNTVK